MLAPSVTVTEKKKEEVAVRGGEKHWKSQKRESALKT